MRPEEVFRSFYFGIALCISGTLSAQTTVASKYPAEAETRVPFVGCESDGQTGPLKAPTGTSRRVAMTHDTALRMAYYKAEVGLGVLAPRGWSCFATYGSNGESLYVSPQPIHAADLFSSNWSGFPGAAIQLSSQLGDTSGRFGVARIIARLFPAYLKFANQVIAEDIEPASAFPLGPHPKDKLIYKGRTIVEFQTPANTDGLGTDSRLKKSAMPISGVVILVEETPEFMPDSLSLSIRLPPDQAGLASAIIQQTELAAKRSRNKSK